MTTYRIKDREFIFELGRELSLDIGCIAQNDGSVTIDDWNYELSIVDNLIDRANEYKIFLAQSMVEEK